MGKVGKPQWQGKWIELRRWLVQQVISFGGKTQAAWPYQKTIDQMEYIEMEEEKHEAKKTSAAVAGQDGEDQADTGQR